MAIRVAPTTSTAGGTARSTSLAGGQTAECCPGARSWVRYPVALPATGNGGDLPDSNAVSNDGRRFVFGDGNQLYYSDGDQVSLLSVSHERATAGQPSATPASFVGAYADLRHIYFRSADQLVDGAPVGGGDYRYDTESGELTFSNPDSQLLGSGGGGFVLGRRTTDATLYYASEEVRAAREGDSGCDEPLW